MVILVQVGMIVMNLKVHMVAVVDIMMMTSMPLSSAAYVKVVLRHVKSKVFGIVVMASVFMNHGHGTAMLIAGILVQMKQIEVEAINKAGQPHTKDQAEAE